MKKLVYCAVFLFSTVFTFGQDKSSPCRVSYIFELDTANQSIKFTNRTSVEVVNWSWDFGDGSTSVLPNPDHIYTKSGTYIACLTIHTDEGCENTFCDTILVDLTPADTNSLNIIEGCVRAGNNILPSGIVLLISKNNSQYIAQTYCNINNGHYEFNSVPAGDYLVYAIPNFNLDVNYYPAYLPTYFGNSTKWQNANIVNPNSSSSYEDIQLYCDTSLLYGPDTISGSLNIADQNSFEYNVYYSNWFGNIGPGPINYEKAPNMPVLLLNNEDKPIRFALTDENGNFRFTNLPIRIYKIFPEKAGLLTIPATINMQTTAAASANCSLVIGTNSIYIGITNPYYYEFEENLHVYPSPAHESITISIATEKPQYVSISVENMLGKEVIQSAADGEKFMSYGNENYFIPILSLPAGLYLVKIQVEGMPLVIRKIIKQ